MDIGVSEGDTTKRRKQTGRKTTPDNQNIGVRVRFTAPVREKGNEKEGKHHANRSKNVSRGGKGMNQGRLGSSIAHRPQAELVEGRAKLRDHPCGLGPHEILTGLLGQGASLGSLVIRLVGVLIVILNDTGGDITRAILLA